MFDRMAQRMAHNCLQDDYIPLYTTTRPSYLPFVPSAPEYPFLSLPSFHIPPKALCPLGPFSVPPGIFFEMVLRGEEESCSSSTEPGHGTFLPFQTALRDRRHSKGHRDEDHVEPGLVSAQLEGVSKKVSRGFSRGGQTGR